MEADEDTLALYGMALDLQAQFFVAAGRLKEAENAWREAVVVATKLHGEEGEQVLVGRWRIKGRRSMYHKEHLCSVRF